MSAHAASVTDVLLLPGLNCDADAWADVAPRLSARVHVPSCAGERSLAAMAARALAEAPARFALAGHSMGARVALEVMALAPERVTHLALLDAGCRALAAGEPGERERQGRIALLDLARRDGMAAMGREWVQGMVHPDRLRDGAFVARIVAMIARHTADQFEAQIAALLDRPDRRALLAAVRVPTLVACGRADTWAPVVQHEEMAALSPGARLDVFERCGHMAPMERPAEVAAALVDLFRLPAPSPHAAALSRTATAIHPSRRTA